MPSCFNPVAARAIHLKDRLSLSRVSLERQHGSHVGIDGAKLIHSERNADQHDRDRQEGQDNLLRRTFFSNKLIIQTI